jgi:hypothetical protein
VGCGTTGVRDHETTDHGTTDYETTDDARRRLSGTWEAGLPKLGSLASHHKGGMKVRDHGLRDGVSVLRCFGGTERGQDDSSDGRIAFPVYLSHRRMAE